MPRKIKAALVSGDLVGTDANDTFILRSGEGHEVVSGFDPVHDKVMFDIGHAWSDIIYLGRLSDGLVFDNGYGTASFSIHAIDENNDGLMDTRIDASSGDSITLLGIQPDQLYGWNLCGG